MPHARRAPLPAPRLRQAGSNDENNCLRFWVRGKTEGTSYIAPVKRENEKFLKNFIFCKNNTLETRPDFANTSPAESHYGFAFNSTILSPITNSESKRYHYPVCHTLMATQHPLSRFQSSARGPGLSPTRSFHGLNVVQRASLVENQKYFHLALSNI